MHASAPRNPKVGANSPSRQREQRSRSEKMLPGKALPEEQVEKKDEK
jgi:hypothetical protein